MIFGEDVTHSSTFCNYYKNKPLCFDIIGSPFLPMNLCLLLSVYTDYT